MAQLSTQAFALPRHQSVVGPRLGPLLGATWLPLIGILIGMASLFHLVQTSEVTATGYSIQDLQIEESNWRLRNEQLALELARARSLVVIEAEATKRLGMVVPKEAVYLHPPTEVLASRTSPVSRGESRAVAQLEKPAPSQEWNPLQKVQQALATALAPRPQTNGR